MSEIPNPEWTEEKLRTFIDSIGKEITEPKRDREYCKAFNGKVLLRLVQNNLPGIIYTVQPDRKGETRFNNPSWWFHSVGIVKIADDNYVIFDQTTEDDGKSFFATGTLDDLSKTLDEKFGSVWDLAFQTGSPDIDEEISVLGKINRIEEQILSGVIGDLSLDDIRPLPSEIPIESHRVEKPLGLKLLPHPTIKPGHQSWPRIRKNFTFKYA